MNLPAVVSQIEDLDQLGGRGVAFNGLGVWRATGIVSQGPETGRSIVSLGKGASLEGRRIAAICEVAERVAMFEAGADRTAAFSEIADRAINPVTQCLDCAEDRDEQCLAWDVGTIVDWSVCHSLVDGRGRLVHRPVRGGPQGFFRHTSNGVAVGASLADASLRGLLEVIERDALLGAWYTADFGLHIPDDAVDLPGREWLSAQGYACALRDITTEFGVPVVLAVGRKNGPTKGTIIGSAAALSYSGACAGAVLEIIQALESQLLYERTGDSALKLTGALQLYAEGYQWALFDAAFDDSAVVPALRDSSFSDAYDVSASLKNAGYEAFRIERRPDWLPAHLAVAEIVVPGLIPLTLSQTLKGRRLRGARLQARLAKTNLANFVTHPNPLG